MMDCNASTEMYIETIYILEQNHGHAHVVDIAKRLGVTKPSVSKAMNQLKEQGFVNQEAYGPIKLTAKGNGYAREIYEKHQLISRYLEKSLRLAPDEASENACRMEHCITDVMLAAIKGYLASDTGQ
jgi:DtxR family transcriptional regulator, Mn-dependent transcriptional regulator